MNLDNSTSIHQRLDLPTYCLLTLQVPIIKLADKLMGIKVDIVFNTQNAEESAKYIQVS